jgi:hypothetical protein
METLVQMAGYLVSVLAAGGIIAGIEALNERCPDAPFARAPRLPVTVPARPAVLRRTRA